MKELARQTGFPPWYIKRQAQRLGLTMHPDRRACTPEELDTLDKLLGKEDQTWFLDLFLLQRISLQEPPGWHHLEEEN